MRTGDGRYIAFISYRHVDPDRAWAQWLHHTLEAYHVPRELQRIGKPARLGRVFRDEEELAASADLSDRIDEALSESSYLIVVCSPRIVSSEWCNREIERFRAMGRGDRILALLVEGEPREAFPPALREIRQSIVREDGTRVEMVSEIEPLAADVRPSTASPGHARRNARLRIIATLLGVRYDDLVNREQQRRIRRLAAATTGAVVLTLAMAALAVFAVLQRIDAVNQRDAAEQRAAEYQAVSAFLADDVLGAFEPERMPLEEARQVMLRLVFDPAAASVRARFSDRPLVEAAVRNVLCGIYCKLQKPEVALIEGDRSVELRQKALGEAHPLTLQSIKTRGWAYELLGREQEAEKAYRFALDEYRAQDIRTLEVASVAGQLAALLHAQQRDGEAEPLAREALATAQALAGQDSIAALQNAATLAGILTATGRTPEGIALFRDVQERSARVFGPNHPETITATIHAGLAMLLENR